MTIDELFRDRDEIAVNVTEEHIERGVGGDCRRCAVALALAEAMPGSDPVVDQFEIIIFGATLKARTQLDVDEFITAFDEAHQLESELPDPMSFTLRRSDFREV